MQLFKLFIYYYWLSHYNCIYFYVKSTNLYKTIRDRYAEKSSNHVETTITPTTTF